MIKKYLLSLFLLLPGAFIHGEMTFSGLDLSEENLLLFQSETDAPVYGSYRSLFLSDLAGGSTRQLTFFPERISLAGGMLQIENRFGIFRTDRSMGTPSPVPGVPSFTDGKDAATGKILPSASSPDGRFLILLRPTSWAFGDLQLLDLAAGSETLIASGVEIAADRAPAAWSADSAFFVYEKQRSLHYFSIAHLREDRVLGEEYRLLGKGSTRSVRWGSGDRLFYLSGSLVYRIGSAELFTRSLYGSLLATSTIVGKLPFPFDPNFDRFWISPDGKKVLLDKGGRQLYFAYLTPDDALPEGGTLSLPYLLLPRSGMIREVLWSAEDLVTILVGSGRDQGAESSGTVYRLAAGEGTPGRFERLSEEGVRGLTLSEDGSRVAVHYRDRVEVKGYRGWEWQASFPHPEPLHSLWTSANELVIAGTRYVEQIHLLDRSSRTICLSQPERYGFGGPAGSVRIESGGRMRGFRAEDGSWIDPAGFAVQKAVVASPSYRVYLEPLQSGSYRNMVMVRNIDGLATLPLLKSPQRRYEAFPAQDDPVDPRVFRHGSRIRVREVGLTFDAVDSAEGLTEVLHVLADYGVRATFFINGEFLRRNPGAAKEIAESGHEIGSLFYAWFDMTDSRYQVDRDFIRKGLARNEDDYFNVSGRELSLLWHTPYYFVNDTMINAAQEMNYRFVGRDLDPLDWVTLQDRGRGSALYLPSARIVERVMKEKKPGSIIPMRIGTPEGGREDYLFQKLELLLNALIAEGYRAVPVSTLMDRVR